MVRRVSPWGPLGLSLGPWIDSKPRLVKYFNPFRVWYQDKMGHRKSGLLMDDLIPEEDWRVQLALSRLTKRELYDRAYRLRIAHQCAVLHRDLPRHQQTTPAQDTNYLVPHIEDILREQSERVLFDLAGVEKRSPKSS